MNDFIKNIMEYIKDQNNIVSISIGFAIFIFTVLFRRQISKGLINMFGKVFFKSDKDKKRSLKESLLNPLSYLLIALSSFFAISINYTNEGITKFFKILIILILCWGFVNYLSNNLFLQLHFGDNVDDKLNTTAIKFIANIMKIVIIAFAIVMVISELGYNVNGLLTGIGVGGLAISLAAQDAVSNLISGFIIVFDKPFKVGDLIQTSSIEGFVEEVTMRCTRIRTLDDSVISVPNSTLTKEAVTNVSMMDKRRIKLSFGITYSTSNDTINKIKGEIHEYIVNNENILPEPVRIHFTDFEESSLLIKVVCYTSTSDMDKYLDICNELNLRIKEIVENNNSDFAFPTKTVYIENK